MPRPGPNDIASPDRARQALLFLAVFGVFSWVDCMLSGATRLLCWAIGFGPVSVVQDAQPSANAWGGLWDALLALAVLIGGLYAAYYLVIRLFNAAKKGGKAPPFRLLGRLTPRLRRKLRFPTVGG